MELLLTTDPEPAETDGVKPIKPPDNPPPQPPPPRLG
jgi:hypothetical protein